MKKNQNQISWESLDSIAELESLTDDGAAACSGGYRVELRFANGTTRIPKSLRGLRKEEGVVDGMFYTPDKIITGFRVLEGDGTSPSKGNYEITFEDTDEREPGDRKVNANLQFQQFPSGVNLIIVDRL